MSDPERMKRLLRYANYAKVGNALGVSRASVAEWAKGRDVSPFRLRQVEELVIPATEEAPRPGWVEGLEARLVHEIQMNRYAITGQVAAANGDPSLQRLEALLAQVVQRLGAQAPSRPPRAGSAPGSTESRGSEPSTK